MSRKWLAMAALLVVIGSLNGCACRNRPGLLARIRGQSPTPSYQPYYPSAVSGGAPYYPSNGFGNGSCCNDPPHMGLPPGAHPGTIPGVTEQGPFQTIPPGNVVPMNPGVPPGPGNAQPMPAGPSGDNVKGVRPGRVTTMPDVK